MGKCGVCNQSVPVDEVSYIRAESDGNLTEYHLSCSAKAKGIKPCEDCGLHRLFCDECKEME